MAVFDQFSENYDAVLAANVRMTGGTPVFFHRNKALWVRRILGPDFRGSILDFGCGVGGLLRELARSLPGAELHGYDPAVPCARHAAEIPGVARVATTEAELVGGDHGAVVIANVLHHVEIDERADLLRRIPSYLRSDGRIIIFEHNPYNPLTRAAVSTCAFDEGVVLLTPKEIRNRLRAAGFTEVRQQHMTFVPGWLSWAVGLERYLGWLPLGAQTCTSALRGEQSCVTR